jgi:hypothetical protein
LDSSRVFFLATPTTLKALFRMVYILGHRQWQMYLFLE